MHSQDFVFTNWLMMYLTDAEVCRFFKRVLGCLVAGGIFHCRESCSQASTTTPKNCAQNPTFYRHASEYIQLLRVVRWTDADGKVYGFQLEWADSVNTYIELKNNWRQVRMMAKKVEIRAENGISKPIGDPNEILLRILRETHVQQDLLDARFAKMQGTVFSPQESILSQVLTKFVGSDRIQGLLNLSPAAVNSFNLAESLDTAVLGTTTDPFTYAAMLGIANQRNDHRVRFLWSDFGQSETRSLLLGKNFNVAIAVDFWSNQVSNRNLGEILRQIRSTLRSGANLFLMQNMALECLEGPLALLNQNGFKLVEITQIPGFAPEAGAAADFSPPAPKKGPWHLVVLQMA